MLHSSQVDPWKRWMDAIMRLRRMYGVAELKRVPSGLVDRSWLGVVLIAGRPAGGLGLPLHPCSAAWRPASRSSVGRVSCASRRSMRNQRQVRVGETDGLNTSDDDRVAQLGHRDDVEVRDKKA